MEELNKIWAWILTVILIPMLTWLTLKHFELRERVARIESNKHIDPIAYTEVIAAMSKSMQYLAGQQEDLKKDFVSWSKDSAQDRQEMRDMLIELLAKQREDKQ